MKRELLLASALLTTACASSAPPPKKKMPEVDCKVHDIRTTLSRSDTVDGFSLGGSGNVARTEARLGEPFSERCLSKGPAQLAAIAKGKLLAQVCGTDGEGNPKGNLNSSLFRATMELTGLDEVHVEVGLTDENAAEVCKP